MRYLFMDNQSNDQKSIKQTSTIPNPIIPENTVSETFPASTISESQIPVTVENPVSTITEIPVSETELPLSPPEPQPEPEIEETAPTGEYQNEYQDILNQYAANQETTAPTLENETPPLPSTPAPTITDSDIFPIPPQNNLFKIIFIISLIIFVLTSTVLAFVYFKNQKSSPTTNSQSSTINNPTPTTTSDTCFLNDKTYQAGETFTATDGCNTCTCVSQNNISCTDKECPSSKTATQSALNSNKTATSSSATQDLKSYTNTKYKYSFKFPSDYKIMEEYLTDEYIGLDITNGSGKGVLAVTVEPNSKNLTLDQIISDTINNVLSQDKNIKTDTQLITISNKVAKQLVFSPWEDSGNTSIFLLSGKNIIEISGDNRELVSKKILESIISTFKLN
ncbi:MAG: PsbP-related protein [Candidatus Shapirobacteria bacterium]|nr:PsbP-related protein [Candidatus Shapirobacteria bacterium]